MGQIVGIGAKVKRCNISAIQTGGSQYNTILTNGEYMLVSSNNSMTTTGNGNFDSYILGDGTTPCGSLTIMSIISADAAPTEGSINPVQSGGVFSELYTSNPLELNITSSADENVIEGYYIKTDGSIESYNTYCYTKPILARGGSVVTYNFTASGTGYLCKATSAEDTGPYTPIETGGTSGEKTYTPTNNEYLVFSCSKSSLSLIHIYSISYSLKYLSTDAIKNDAEKDSDSPISSGYMYDILNKDTNLIYYNEDNSSSFYVANFDGTARARGEIRYTYDLANMFLFPLSVIKYEIVVNIADDSSLQYSIVIIRNNTTKYDSGWRSSGSITATIENGGSDADKFYIYGKNGTTEVPTYNDIAQNASFSFRIYTQYGLIQQVEHLPSYNEVAMDWRNLLQGRNYIGKRIYVGEMPFGNDTNMFTCIKQGVIGSRRTAQGGAAYNNYLFQFYYGPNYIDIYNLDSNSVVQSISLENQHSTHAGSGGFSSQFYNSSDPFPLLYISSMTDKIIDVYRFTGTVGSLEIELIQQITLDTNFYFPNITIDARRRKIIIFAYTQNSWDDETNNESIVLTADIPSVDSNITISQFSEPIYLPFIHAEQGAFAIGGKLYLSFGNSSTGHGKGIVIINYLNGMVENYIGLNAVQVGEPEALVQYNGIIYMTDHITNVYKFTFS